MVDCRTTEVIIATMKRSKQPVNGAEVPETCNKTLQAENKVLFMLATQQAPTHIVIPQSKVLICSHPKDYSFGVTIKV
jgi:hypothetical protein